MISWGGQLAAGLLVARVGHMNLVKDLEGQ